MPGSSRAGSNLYMISEMVGIMVPVQLSQHKDMHQWLNCILAHGQMSTKVYKGQPVMFLQHTGNT